MGVNVATKRERIGLVEIDDDRSRARVSNRNERSIVVGRCSSTVDQRPHGWLAFPFYLVEQIRGRFGDPSSRDRTKRKFRKKRKIGARGT